MQEYIMITPKQPALTAVMTNNRQRELMRRARALQRRRQAILDEKLKQQHVTKRHYPTWLQVALHHER